MFKEFPECKDLLKCLRTAHDCTVKYAEELLDYYLETDDVVHHEEIVRLIVSIETVVTHLDPERPLSLFTKNNN